MSDTYDKNNEIQYNDENIEIKNDEEISNEAFADESNMDEVNIDEVNIDETAIDEASYDEMNTDEISADETITNITNIDDKIADVTSADDTYTLNSVVSSIWGRISAFIYDLKTTTPRRRNRILTFMMASVLLLVLILTDIIPILPNPYNRFYVGNTYTIGETQGGIYDKIGKNIIYAGNGTVMAFGPDMACILKVDTPIGVSRLETEADNAIVYFKNSNEALLVHDGGKSVKSLTQKDIIKAATINPKGFYGLVTDESGYEACVNVFNPNGSSVYRWHTNNPVLDMSISKSGRNAVVASYNTDGTVMSGKLIFIDTEKSEPLKEVVTGSNVVSEVKFINDSVAIAFGDLYTAAYTKDGVMKWRVDYSGRTLKTYDIAPNGEFAFVFDRYSSEMSESTVELYNTNGRLMGKYESKDNVKYVSANNSRFLLSLDKQTVLLDDDADVMKKRESKKDFRHAVLYHNYNFAFSISDSVAEVMSVNH